MDLTVASPQLNPSPVAGNRTIQKARSLGCHLVDEPARRPAPGPANDGWVLKKQNLTPNFFLRPKNAFNVCNLQSGYRGPDSKQSLAQNCVTKFHE